VKSPSPVQSLVFLLVAGLAIAGWFYGLHWKRVAAGGKPIPRNPVEGFTQEEKVIVELQDQISALTEENDSLHKRIRELEGTGAIEAEPSPAGEVGAPPSLESIILPSSNGPALPALPQKIETH
jgi:hypothetical protein